MTATMVFILGGMLAAIAGIAATLLVLAGYVRFGRRRVPLALATKIWEMPSGIGTMAGALLSFVVVTGGYLINGELTRQKDILDRETRKADLAYAFQSEIGNYRLRAHVMCSKFAQVLGRFAVVGGIEYPLPVVWQTKVGEIGLLGAAAASRVQFFYTVLESARSVAENQNKTTEVKFSSAATLAQAADEALPALEAITQQSTLRGYAPPDPCTRAPTPKFPPRHPLDPPD